MILTRKSLWPLLAAGLLIGSVLAGVAEARSPSATTASIVAQARGSVLDVYRSPRARRPFLQLASPNAYGAPVVLLVVSRRPGWEKVRLPVRPNGTTGWIRDRSVTLARDPYRVEVSLGAHRIVVWDGSRVVMRRPVAVGRPVSPTPSGTYFIVGLLQQPNPHGPYGPYAFGLSAFSNVLFSFGGGPGQIGLHGTDDPASLGTGVSHGCIRISNAGIRRLASLLPLGTPVRIVG